MQARAAWIIIAGALGAGVGCSDDEGGTSAAQTTTTTSVASTSTSSTGGSAGSPASSSSSTGGMGMGPGTITIQAQGISAQDTWLFSAAVVEGTMPLARMCDTVSGGSASGVASEILPQMDTCQLGEPVIFDEGTYQIKGALYEPNCQEPCSPSLCVATDVTVAGNVTVVVPPFQACVGN